jgi:hypothetical protein
MGNELRVVVATQKADAIEVVTILYPPGIILFQMEIFSVARIPKFGTVASFTAQGAATDG